MAAQREIVLLEEARPTVVARACLWELQKVDNLTVSHSK